MVPDDDYIMIKKDIIKAETENLLDRIDGDIIKAYRLEAVRSEFEEDNDPSSARLITQLKMCRGILRTRLKEGK